MYKCVLNTLLDLSFYHLFINNIFFNLHVFEYILIQIYILILQYNREKPDSDHAVFFLEWLHVSVRYAIYIYKKWMWNYVAYIRFPTSADHRWCISVLHLQFMDQKHILYTYRLIFIHSLSWNNIFQAKYDKCIDLYFFTQHIPD